MDFGFILEAFPQILAAIPITLLMVFASAIIGWILGLIIALVRKGKAPVISQILAVFVSFMRSVPSVIVLYIAYYVMPAVIFSYGQNIGWNVDINLIPPVVYAIFALTLGQAAYSSDYHLNSDTCL